MLKIQILGSHQGEVCIFNKYTLVILMLLEVQGARWAPMECEDAQCSAGHTANARSIPPKCTYQGNTIPPSCIL